MSRRAENIGAVAALSDTLRRRLYYFIRAQARPVSRDEAAEHAGISRRLAAFHLDKLTRSGLLRSHYGRPEGAPKGPGRAPKLYQPTDSEFEVAIPARQYDLIGQILIDAMGAIDSTDGAGVESGSNDRGVTADADAPDTAESTVEETTVGCSAADPDQPPHPHLPGDLDEVSGAAGVAALRAATVRGAEVGADARTGTRAGRLGPERAFAAAASVLETLGYEPVRTSADLLCLRNCPFHRLAVRSPALVCGINQAFVEGVLQGLDTSGVRAELAPGEGHCCVRIRGAGEDD